MSAPMIYISFPGTARQALSFCADVFGGEVSLHTCADFGRADRPPEAIAHGVLDGGVSLAGSDAPAGEKTIAVEGVMLSLLGTAEPNVLHRWFERLSDGGTVIDPLAPKPWEHPMVRSSTSTGFTG